MLHSALNIGTVCKNLPTPSSWIRNLRPFTVDETLVQLQLVRDPEGVVAVDRLAGGVVGGQEAAA